MLSIIILTKNEEKNILRAIKSVDFADEIIVADDSSEDNTAEVAKKYKARIISLKKEADFSKKRNSVLNEAKGEWVLFLDADEEISYELKQEIILTLKKPEFSSYYLKRRDFFWRRELKYGETKKIREQGIIRLFKRNAGKWQGKVHETFQTVFPAGKLNNYLNHYPHPTIKSFLEKVNYYSGLRAQELFDSGKKTNILEIVFLPLGKFILNYFIYLGFLDGPAGFTYAFMMSFHSFLVRGKLFELQTTC